MDWHVGSCWELSLLKQSRVVNYWRVFWERLLVFCWGIVA